MGAETDFPADNWLRATGMRTAAGVAAYCVQNRTPAELRQFCSRGASVKVLAHQGWSNFTLLIENPRPSPKWLLRIKRKPTSNHAHLWSSYHKEEWCHRVAGKVIPVPAIPANGVGYFSLNILPNRAPIEFAYMVQEYIQAESAQVLDPATPAPEFLIQLGDISRRIHTIQGSGFGADFDNHSGSFSGASLQQIFEQEISQLEDTASYSLGSKRLAERALGSLQLIADLECESRLAHRDFLFNWGNVLLNPGGGIAAIIDWEFAYCGPAFYLETGAMLYALLRDGFPTEERERRLLWFLKGYGMSERVYRSQHATHVEAFLTWYALKAVHKCQAAMQQGTLKSEPWRRLFAERSIRYLRASHQQKHSKALVRPKVRQTKAA
ncbi:MAG: aminoglycoside phosphotransferase family protein [Deltaproteobacteria bacterium]|nr:aminoglycoside phosphotransferase family protein [Deltaproteobacteria bacterium]